MSLTFEITRDRQYEVPDDAAIERLLREELEEAEVSREGLPGENDEDCPSIALARRRLREFRRSRKRLLDCGICGEGPALRGEDVVYVFNVKDHRYEGAYHFHCFQQSAEWRERLNHCEVEYFLEGAAEDHVAPAEFWGDSLALLIHLRKMFERVGSEVTELRAELRRTRHALRGVLPDPLSRPAAPGSPPTPPLISVPTTHPTPRDPDIVTDPPPAPPRPGRSLSQRDEGGAPT